MRRQAQGIPMLEIVDVGGLSGGNPEAIRWVGAQIGRACRDTGFFYVSDHGITEGLTSGIFKTARSFFAAPLPIQIRTLPVQEVDCSII
jgi:isopenicillin N synthase-like dioxygenase